MFHMSQVSQGVNINRVTQLFSAGVIATAVMMAFAYLLRSIGVPAPDFAAQYGAILNSQTHPAISTTMWWAGLAWHAVNGVLIFPLIYHYLAHRLILPNRRWTNGLLFGAGIWLMVSTLVAPLAGEGFFFRNMSNSFIVALTALGSWLTYGVILDGMSTTRVTRQLDIVERQAA